MLAAHEYAAVGRHQLTLLLDGQTQSDKGMLVDPAIKKTRQVGNVEVHELCASRG